VIRAMRLGTDHPPLAIGIDALPPQPGGGVWCDLPRAVLRGTASRNGQQPASGQTPRPSLPAPLVAWLQGLHPLTRFQLAERRRRHLALAHSHYVHVRLPLPTPPAATDGSRALDVVLGPNFALTVHDGRCPPLERVWAELIAGSRGADTVDFALYQALRRVLARAYRPLQRTVVRAADRVVEQLTERHRQHLLPVIVRLRRQASRARALLVPAADALGLLAAGAADAAGISPAHRPFYADLERQAQELLSAVQDVQSTLTEAVEAYTSVQSTEMNRVMQLFTVAAVVFMPPTLIASIYGMNFQIPEYRWSWGYAWALGWMAASAAALAWWFRRQDWL